MLAVLCLRYVVFFFFSDYTVHDIKAMFYTHHRCVLHWVVYFLLVECLACGYCLQNRHSRDWPLTACTLEQEKTLYNVVFCLCTSRGLEILNTWYGCCVSRPSSDSPVTPWGHRAVAAGVHGHFLSGCVHHQETGLLWHHHARWRNSTVCLYGFSQNVSNHCVQYHTVPVTFIIFMVELKLCPEATGMDILEVQDLPGNKY